MGSPRRRGPPVASIPCASCGLRKPSSS
jgi:hypothetical protein